MFTPEEQVVLDYLDALQEAERSTDDGLTFGAKKRTASEAEAAELRAKRQATNDARRRARALGLTLPSLIESLPHEIFIQILSASVDRGSDSIHEYARVLSSFHTALSLTSSEMRDKMSNVSDVLYALDPRLPQLRTFVEVWQERFDAGSVSWAAVADDLLYKLNDGEINVSSNGTIGMRGRKRFLPTSEERAIAVSFYPRIRVEIGDWDHETNFPAEEVRKWTYLKEVTFENYPRRDYLEYAKLAWWFLQHVPVAITLNIKMPAMSAMWRYPPPMAMPSIEKINMDFGYGAYSDRRFWRPVGGDKQLLRVDDLITETGVNVLPNLRTLRVESWSFDGVDQDMDGAPYLPSTVRVLEADLEGGVAALDVEGIKVIQLE